MRAEGHLLAVVLVELGGERHVVAVDGHDLAQDVPERGVRSHVDAASRRDADFRRVAAAQHGTVLQQQRLHAVACRRLRHADAGDAAADDHEVPALLRVAETERAARLLPVAQRARLVRRQRLGIRREPERVAASVEARQVAQANLDGHARLEIDVSRELPVPVLAERAEFGRQGLAVHDHLETPGRALRPDRVPVARARPHGVAPFRRELRRRHRVLHRRAVAVRHHVAGPDLPHRVRVDDPPAEVAEAFAFHVQASRRRLQRGKRSNDDCCSSHSFPPSPSLCQRLFS